MVNLELKYFEMINHIKKIIPFPPEISIVLGSGLGDYANTINTIKSIKTSELPNYPRSTVQGHDGFIHFSEINGKKVVLFQGRIHVYEGYSIDQSILPAYISSKLGCKKILLTNAAGGINPNFNPGDLMLVSDFHSFNIKKELSHILSIPSPDTKAKIINLPSVSFNNIIKASSLEEQIFLKEGEYWFGKGPSYETPSEIKMLAKYGIDAVGMSTVHEAVYSAVKGLEVAAISLITNYAAGISKVKLSHKEVIETAEAVKKDFERLVSRIIKNL